MSKQTQTEKQIKAQQDFVEGFLDNDGARVYPTIAEAGRRHKIPRATVYRLAKENNWQERRNHLLAKVEEKRTEISARTQADERALLDKRCLQLVEAGLSQVAAAFSQAQEVRSNGILVDGRKYTMPASQLESLMRSLLNAQKVGKLALGEAQEIQKVAADVSVSDAFNELVREVEELGRRKASFGNHSIN